ncbi:MAG TPA: hypothetical protein VLI04_01340 [Nocardioidaceae bacterium]|nr:hypothetical protein [Nocardioidaceae bacterium]
MSVAEALERLGGVADQRTLVRLTSRRAVRRALASGDVARDARGRLALPTADVAMRRAAALGGVVSDLSAAARWGWSLKKQPEVPQVTIPKHRRVTGSKSGVRFVDLHPDDVEGGVTSRDRTLIDCLRRLPFDESLCIADSYLRDGAAASSLLALARRRYNWLVRNGWTVLRFAWEDVMHEQEYVLDLLRTFSRTQVRTEVPSRRPEVA